MKIKQNHYDTMEMHINRVIADNPHLLSDYEKAGLSGKRYRWDMLRRAQFPAICGQHAYNVNGITWICDNLYSYLDDSHIDTALRKITGTN